MVMIAGHGLTMELHPGWEARIWRPQVEPPATSGPVIRLANFPLPATKDTYAAGVAEILAPGALVASLVEFDSALAGVGLYAPRGVPRLRVEDLDPKALQASGPGRLGVQRFFSLRGRAFSLYLMAREGPGLREALQRLNATLASLATGPA